MLSANAKQFLIKKKLTLASGSPRRKVLLGKIGIPFEAIASDIDEDIAERSAIEKAKKLARLKAGHLTQEDKFTIGSDTLVFFEDQILEKPKNEYAAASMLESLSGQWHMVVSAIAFYEDLSLKFLISPVTRVLFKKLSLDTIRSYIATGSPFDKAGGYGIQDDFGKSNIEKVEGDYDNVMGFSVTAFTQEIEKLV